jgi:hypothetical protein
MSDAEEVIAGLVEMVGALASRSSVSAVRMEVEGGDEGVGCSAGLCHWAFISSSFARILTNISSVVMVARTPNELVRLPPARW